MSEFFDPARPGLPSPPWSHFKKKTQRSPIARSVWGRVGLAAKSGGFAGREESCGREFKLAGPVQSHVNAPVRSPRCFQKGKTLPPFSSAALSVNMKCWKSRSRQRLFAGPDIWHSCPQQRRHVPAEPGHIHRLWQTSGPQQRATSTPTQSSQIISSHSQSSRHKHIVIISAVPARTLLNQRLRQCRAGREEAGAAAKGTSFNWTRPAEPSWGESRTPGSPPRKSRTSRGRHPSKPGKKPRRLLDKAATRLRAFASDSADKYKRSRFCS